MLLTELIKEDRVILNLKSLTKKDAIKEMAEHFKQLGLVEDKDKFIEKILERESIESTGIGEGIAIPHARCDSVKELSVVFARSEQGVEFDSIDGKPVHLIFMIGAPQDVKKEYLQTIAKIARLLKTRHYKEDLLKAKTVKEIMQVFTSFDDRFPREMAVKTKNGRVIHQKGE